MLRQALCVCKCFSRVSWRSASCPGRRCVCANVSLVSVGAPRHVPALPAWGKAGVAAWSAVFCRALGQSAQAERDNLILCSSQESVRPLKLPKIEMGNPTPSDPQAEGRPGNSDRGLPTRRALQSARVKLDICYVVQSPTEGGRENRIPTTGSNEVSSAEQRQLIRGAETCPAPSGRAATDREASGALVHAHGAFGDYCVRS